MTLLVPLVTLLVLAATGFFINTLILLVALVIMLKLQKMEIKWLWLIGAAILATLLDTIFPIFGIPMVGHALAVVSLLLNIYYMSNSEYIDAVFTVTVGYAVKFTLNMFLLTALLPDLRPDLKAHRNMAMEDETNAPIAAAPAKSPGPSTNKSPTASSAPAKPANPPVAPAPPVHATPIAPAAPAGQATNMSPEQVGQIVKNFSLKGIIPASASGVPPLAIVNTGARNYTMSPGDAVVMDTGTGRYKVRCQKIGDKAVVLNVGGQPVTLSLPEEKELIIQ